MKKIKVGIISQGRSGGQIHRHLFECCPKLQERFDVVAVADPIAERCVSTNIGSNPDCRIYSDYRELLQDKNVELVVNACRSHKHADISIEAMRAGYEVVCEKPLAKQVSEVDRVLAVQKETGKFFAVFQQARFRPIVTKIREVIQSGILGKIISVKVTYAGFGRRWDWQTVQDLNGGELLNTAPHPLDQMIAIWDIFGASEPERIFARLERVNNTGDAEDYVKVIFDSKDHPLFDLEVTKQSLFPGRMYQVYGTNGSLAADGNTVEWKYFIPEDAPVHETCIETLEGEGRMPLYCGEKLDFDSEVWNADDSMTGFDYWGDRFYRNIYNALTAGEPLEVRLSQVRRQVAIIEECYRQNPLEKFITVPEGML